MARLQVVHLPGERYGIVIDGVDRDVFHSFTGDEVRRVESEEWALVGQSLDGVAEFTIIVADELDVQSSGGI